MALASGTKLGPYEIASPLGAGGMGEVYRARDTRLDRSVAIKILPAHLADKVEAGERFEREARTISSLNHPNICQLHDVGTQGGTRYLVMELLEGETLAERLRRGPLPLPQALRYGAEIATGLQAAHRCGVVHRDLKPGNIMLTKSGAKLMDFGLAKGMSVPKPASTELTATLTSSHTTPLTQQGTIVGTFQYMSPEQVEGKEADARSDIFSLGCVLYEMVSGKRAFEGKTLVSVAASILEKEPEPIRTVQPLTPASLERAINKCLAKDPEDRWQSAGDLASELKWIADGTASGTHPAPQPGHRSHMRVSEWMAWMFLGMAVIAIVVLSLVLGFSGGHKQVVRMQIAPSDKLQFKFVGDEAGPPAISPDGKEVVFSAKETGEKRLYLRSMDKLAPQPIPGTERATFPFWSPDSKTIAFFADGKLKRADLAGGPPAIVCDAAIGRGGAWNADGTILFSGETTAPITRVPATGGTPVAVTKLTGRYTTHRWPAFLPDGKHFLYLAAIHTTLADPETAVFWASLDGKENRLVVRSFSNAIYASGYLLYVRDNTLVAQPFEPSSGELRGQASVLNDDVQVDGTVWRGTFSASESGTLLYQPGAAGGGMRLTWMDRSGKTTGEMLGPGAYYEVQLSPDDRRAAVVDTASSAGTIWIVDVARGTRNRLTYNGSYSDPVWSPDGKKIAYMTGAIGGGVPSAIAEKAADGSGEERKLLDLNPADGITQDLNDWSPDGRYLIFSKGSASVGNGTDLWILPLFGDGKPYPYYAGPGNQLYGQFSPDGKWVTYASDESGRQEVYVAPFPWTGAKWQVSSNSGHLPRWRGDGKEIYFDAPGNDKEFAADVSAQGTSFQVGQIRDIFEVSNLSPSIVPAQYAVTRDGQRFLLITTGVSGMLPLTVIQNWTAELKKR
jgi:serine/threonine protein kinase/Tol biopolymer transport system component